MTNETTVNRDERVHVHDSRAIVENRRIATALYEFLGRAIADNNRKVLWLILSFVRGRKHRLLISHAMSTSIRR